MPADPRVLKILDFGTTSPLDGMVGEHSASPFFCSPAFIAPEQIKDAGSGDARSDVWALGVLLHNLISGALPFEADTVSGVLVAVVYDAPSLLTHAPYDLARLVHRCLEKDPAKRPQNVSELAVELAPFAGDQGARLSERVRAMLESTPALAMSVDREDEAIPEEDEAAALGSELSLPLAGDVATAPSQRVVITRRRESRTRTALALLGAAAVFTFVTWRASTGAPYAQVGEALLVSAPEGAAQSSLPESTPRAATDVPPSVPAITQEVPEATPTIDVPIPVLSFAPDATDAMMPTPLVVTATPLAVGEPAAPAELPSPRFHAPPTLLPPPRAEKAAPWHLPAGLPRTRDARDGRDARR